MKNIMIGSVLVVMLSCCIPPQHRNIQKEGISGRVFWLEGNVMPSPEPGQRAGKIPVKRQIVVYKLIKLDEVDDTHGPLFKQLPGSALKSAWSDRSGNFSICLPPGSYSVFTVEDEGYFANRFDGQGNIQAVIVQEGQFTDVTIDIDYKAYY
jgi:hypothetical protein